MKGKVTSSNTTSLAWGRTKLTSTCYDTVDSVQFSTLFRHEITMWGSRCQRKREQVVSLRVTPACRVMLKHILTGQPSSTGSRHHHNDYQASSGSLHGEHHHHHLHNSSLHQDQQQQQQQQQPGQLQPGQDPLQSLVQQLLCLQQIEYFLAQRGHKWFHFSRT